LGLHSTDAKQKQFLGPRFARQQAGHGRFIRGFALQSLLFYLYGILVFLGFVCLVQEMLWT